MPNHPYLYLTVHAREAILHTQQVIITTKAPVDFQPRWL